MHVYLNYYKKKLPFFFTIYKNEWKEHKFRQQKKSKKVTSTKTKKILNIYDTDVNKILVSKKEPYGTNNALRYFVGYNDIDAIRPLYLRLSKMTGYIIIFDENKNKNTITISLKVNGKQNYI